MYAKIGPYKNYIGPYQIAESLLFWMDKDDDRVYNFGTWLAGKEKESFLTKLCLWIHSKRKRKIKIHIDKYDVYNMDSTLSMIILPMLRLLKEKKIGAPEVEDADVPEHLRRALAGPKENDWDPDSLYFDRWDWVLDEMIWAFEQHLDEDLEEKFSQGKADFVLEEGNSGHIELKTGPNHTYTFDHEGYKKHLARMQNGFALFGKYYQNLWY